MLQAVCLFCNVTSLYFHFPNDAGLAIYSWDAYETTKRSVLAINKELNSNTAFHWNNTKQYFVRRLPKLLQFCWEFYCTLKWNGVHDETLVTAGLCAIRYASDWIPEYDRSDSIIDGSAIKDNRVFKTVQNARQ